MKGFSHLAYYWLVEYEDGTQISQFESSGLEHKYSEVKSDKIKRIGWIPFDKNLKPVSIRLEKSEKTVIYRKNFLQMIGGKQEVVFVIGVEGHPNIWIFEDEIVIGNSVV